MLRRSFIGSVIGTLVGSNIPFYANQRKEPIFEDRDIMRFKNFIKMFTSPQHTLMQYTMDIFTKDGERFASPPIDYVSDIYEQNTIFGKEVRRDFKYKAVEISHDISIQGVHLINESGVVVAGRAFDGEQKAIKGDIYIATYHIVSATPQITYMDR